MFLASLALATPTLGRYNTGNSKNTTENVEPLKQSTSDATYIHIIHIQVVVVVAVVMVVVVVCVFFFNLFLLCAERSSNNKLE